MSLRSLGLSLSVVLAACTTQNMAKTIDVDASAPVTADSLSYWTDIFPLAQQHCTSCHQAGGSGPFSMLDESTVAAKMALINSMIGSGEMPPWRPTSGCRDLQGDRTMSQADTQKFLAWSSQPTPVMGTAPNPLPTATAVPGLARVDSSLAMAQAYTPATTADAPDHYQCFILDPKLAADADLIGYNVRPGAVKEVHHVLLYPANPSDAQQLDDATPNEVGWTCFGGPGTPNPTTVGGWVPGSSAVSFPANTGIALKAGQILIMQVHYNTNYVAPSPDLSTLELELATTPVQKHALILPVLNTGFSVPVGATNYPVIATATAPASGTVWGVLPHAHTHAQVMKVESDAGCMIDIPTWEFQWQQMYFFTDPIAVTQGQQVKLTCTYNNTGSAPLTWGELTSDEMCLNYLYVTP
jgi:hypothetical protein